MYNTINSFSEVHASDVESALSKRIKEEIEQKGKEYILGVDENEYKNYLIEEYTLEPLKIYLESEVIDAPKFSKEKRQDDFYHRREYETEVYTFTVHYNYTGNVELFKVRPNPWTITSAEIFVTANSVSFSFKLYNKDPETFRYEKESKFKHAFTNLDGVNRFANEWNSKLSSIVNSHFQLQKKKYLIQVASYIFGCLLAKKKANP